jgi:hypothetical protein
MYKSDRQGLTLGQVATEEKRNEIKAAPNLLDIVDMQGME